MAILKQAYTRGVTDKLLVVKGNKRKCVFSNPNQHLLTKVKADGCQITDGIECDYLILDHCHSEHFIESKGRDLSHVVEQLEASIQRLSVPNHTVKEKAIIVSSRNPSNDTLVQRVKVMLKKEREVEFIPESIQIEITTK